MIAPSQILIVDDIPANLDLLCKSLKKADYRIITAQNGQQALEVAEKVLPDLILLDINMPDIDGYEVCRRLKEKPFTHSIPVIMVTGFIEKRNIELAFNAGAIDYITKPINRCELLTRIRHHLDLHWFSRLLQEKINLLSKEIEKRQQAEAECRRINQQLEKQVEVRTAELLNANNQLKQEIESKQELAQALFKEKELALVTLESIDEGVITTNVWGQIEYLNPMAEQLTGWTLEQSKGNPLPTIYQIFNGETKQRVENPVEIVRRTGKVLKQENNIILISADGQEYAIKYSASPIYDRQQKMMGMVIVFEDITQSQRKVHQLQWDATHDHLTGLFNRSAFEDAVQEAIENAPYNNHHVICFLDLDQFKAVNDTYGHAAGDEVLRQISKLIQKQVRSSDILARLGGDEFALLLHHCPLSKGQEIAENIRQIIHNFCFSYQNHTFSLSVSIGLSPIDANATHLESVIHRADTACYAAKANHRNCVAVYSQQTVA